MTDLSRFLPSWTNLLIIPGIIAGFTVHELGHTFVAYLLGDVSQVERGRITLNPFRHISWFGAFTFVLFGFGWARPVQVDPSRFKRRYVDMFLVAIAGATANLLLAGLILVLTLLLVALVAIFSQQDVSEVTGLLLNVDLDTATGADIVSWTAAFTTYAIYANLALAFFNLLPFPTLDGFTVLASLIGMLRDFGDEPEPAGASQGPEQTPSRQSTRSRTQRRPAAIHFEMGAEYHAQGKYEDAIARYRQAIASNRNHGPAYVNMGLAYLALNQRTRAIQAFRGATQYATDEKSRREAWAQLHKLSESPSLTKAHTAPAAETKAAQTPVPDASPWTGTVPTPNWLAFGVSSLVTIAITGCLYIYLTVEMIRYLS
jgi:Zn-dependent protease